jgi:hypothetical protein
MNLTKRAVLKSFAVGGIWTGLGSRWTETQAAPQAVDVTKPLPAVGIYSGYGLRPSDAQAKTKAFEAIIGRPVDYLVEFGAHTNWGEARGSANHALRTWRQVATGSRRKMLWNQPLTMTNVPLDAVAAGQHDTTFQAIATTLRSNGFYDAIVRLGWDMNGDWVPWSVKAETKATYFQAYRRVVAVFRSVSPSFRICWSPARHVQLIAPDEVYPGSDVVDFIGASIMPASAPAGLDYPEFFDKTVIGHGKVAIDGRLPYSLAWLAEFGQENGKPIVIAEYGAGELTGNGDQTSSVAVFVRLMADWIKRHDVALHCWRDPADATLSPNPSVPAAAPPPEPLEGLSEGARAFRTAWKR